MRINIQRIESERNVPMLKVKDYQAGGAGLPGKLRFACDQPASCPWRPGSTSLLLENDATDEISKAVSNI
jgi:hypothetical protein